MTARIWPLAALLALGAGWGLTLPLVRIAVSDGYRHFGIIFWQLVIGVLLLGLLTGARGLKMRWSARHLRLYLVIAALGTLLPNAASFEAARHLPAGVMSILISMVPIFALPVALLWGLERFEWRRAAGLVLGLGAVALIAAPGAGLPGAAAAAFVPFVLFAAFCYALEAGYVARYGTLDIDPVRTLLGASLVGLPVALALALATGQFIDPFGPWGAPDGAVAAASVIHTLVYAGYVWLVGRAGSVFASQVAYLVTIFGVLFAIVLLGERYSGWIWAALILMLGGLRLVQPRLKDPLAAAVALGKDGAV